MKSKKEVTEAAERQVKAFKTHGAPLKNIPGVARERKLESLLAKIEQKELQLQKLEAKAKEVRAERDAILAELDAATAKNKKLARVGSEHQAFLDDFLG